ncbi:MAG: hypothetical protein PVJ66_04890 [Gammaproteobacteria bacterium]|jgi:hypothetical protein
MDRKNCIGTRPIPEDLKEALNDAQLQALNCIQGSSWELRFVRRPRFQGIVPVIVNSEDNSCGILEENGDISMQPGIDLHRHIA